MITPSPTSPITRIWTPNLPWDGLVRALIVRDTRGCMLAPKARLNRFPASSHCVITWFMEGEASLQSIGGQAVNQRLAGCVVSGCQSSPFASDNPGDVHAFMAMFYPSAFHTLFGVDLALLQNRFVDAALVLPAHGNALVQAVFAAQSDQARQHVLEQFLEAHAPPTQTSPWMRLRHLGKRISLSTASAVLGVGNRQSQRVALRETGINLQTLFRLWRGERSFMKAQGLHRLGKPIPLAAHAVESEYADQSHLVRECKAQTGRTPAQLVRDVQTEEADWVYRLEFPDPDQG